MNIDPSLIAIQGELKVLDDEETLIYLKGNDTSGFNRTLRFQIKTIPLHGDLYDSDGRILGVNKLTSTKSSYPYDKGCVIKFVSEKDFFNEPYSLDRGFVDSDFSFAAVAPDDEYKASFPAKQEMTVVNVNDPPTLSIPYTEKTVHAFSSLSWDPDLCSNGFTSSKCKSKMITNEINVNDVDNNIDFVRVDISSTQGMISLNSEHLNKTDFASCSNRTQLDLESSIVWNCKGSGNGDQEMTFIALPLDLNDIFRNLTYESLNIGVDTVVVAIYDGEGQECLSSIEHAERLKNNMHMGTPTVHHHCTSVIRSLSIKIVKYDVPELGAMRKVPFQLKIACFFAVTVIMLFTTILPMIRWRNARKELKATQRKNRKRTRTKQAAMSRKEKMLRRSRVARIYRKTQEASGSMEYRSETSGEMGSYDDRCSDEDSSGFEYISDEEQSFESLSSQESQDHEIPFEVITNDLLDDDDNDYDDHGSRDYFNDRNNRFV